MCAGRRWRRVDDLDLGREFFALLEPLDEAMARRVAVEGCPRCGEPLHRGDSALFFRRM